MGDIEKEIIKSLEDFSKKLEAREPIEVVHVQCIHTPDGPMHVTTKSVLEPPKE